jgi:hypothetical protein
LRVDPLASKAPDWTPYRFCFNNPINITDPTGLLEDNFVFDENGDYLYREINDQPHKLVIENQETCERTEYQFADPVNDPKQIEEGVINKVVFVGVEEIRDMKGAQGAFDKKNTDRKLSYMLKGARAGKGLDYSYSTISKRYKDQGASQVPSIDPSPMLFIPTGDGYAHNHMNFGNFLYGATGSTVGVSLGTLKFGAHVNSIVFSRGNGYRPQLDSADDQLSITRGVRFAQREQFRDNVK